MQYTKAENESCKVDKLRPDVEHYSLVAVRHGQAKMLKHVHIALKEN